MMAMSSPDMTGIIDRVVGRLEQLGDQVAVSENPSASIYIELMTIHDMLEGMKEAAPEDVDVRKHIDELNELIAMYAEKRARCQGE